MISTPPTFYISPDLIAAPTHTEQRVMTQIHTIESSGTRIEIKPKGVKANDQNSGENRFVSDLMSYFHTNYDKILAS